jgi:hypothetical protein
MISENRRTIVLERVALARNGLPSVARGLATLGFETRSLRDWQPPVKRPRLN